MALCAMQVGQGSGCRGVLQDVLVYLCLPSCVALQVGLCVLCYVALLCSVAVCGTALCVLDAPAALCWDICVCQGCDMLWDIVCVALCWGMWQGLVV